MSLLFKQFYCLQLVLWDILEVIVVYYVLIQLTVIDVCQENALVQNNDPRTRCLNSKFIQTDEDQIYTFNLIAL